MNKLFLYLTFSLFLMIPVIAQSSLSPDELIRKNIEEKGIPGNTVTGVSDFSPESTTWTSIADAPEPFGRSIGGKIGDYIYVFCGQANNSLAIAYNISTGTWAASTVPGSPAYNPSFCVADGELYKLSGTAAVSVFEKFTPDGSGTGTWTALTGGPSEIMNAQSTIAWDGGDYIYAHSTSYTTPAVSYLARYSISGNSWTNLTPTTLAKRYAGLKFLNGYLYLIGGLVPTGDDPTTCAKYDPSTDTWSSIASLPEAVNFCKWTTTKVPDYIVLVGSGGGYSTYPSNPKIFYYNPSDDSWTYDSDVPAERGLALGFFMPGNAELFYGGGNMGGSSTNYQMNCWTGEASFIPVELVSFSANVDGANVILNWSTATETNNKGFEIQRASSGWERIGFVPGYGTSTLTHSYSFTDKDVKTGNYSYRLKQIDLNGSFEYSNVIEVQMNAPAAFSLKQNYPNPFNPVTSIEYSTGIKQLVTLRIYDVLGKEIKTLVNEVKNPGVYEIKFNGVNLPSGVYLYKLNAGDFVQTKKMILLR